MLAGDATAVEHDPTASKMLSIIRESSALGDFGTYKSVVEVSPGWELFTPGPAARPTAGAVGASSTSPTVILTLYVREEVPREALEQDLKAILAAHPWEVPVIEIGETRLLVKSG